MQDHVRAALAYLKFPSLAFGVTQLCKVCLHDVLKHMHASCSLGGKAVGAVSMTLTKNKRERAGILS